MSGVPRIQWTRVFGRRAAASNASGQAHLFASGTCALVDAWLRSGMPFARPTAHLVRSMRSNLRAERTAGKLHLRVLFALRASAAGERRRRASRESRFVATARILAGSAHAGGGHG